MKNLKNNVGKILVVVLVITAIGVGTFKAVSQSFATNGKTNVIFAGERDIEDDD